MGVNFAKANAEVLPDDQTAQPQATPINKIPIYRAAKYQGGYFYTADLAEYKTAVNYDMRLESGPNGESPAFYATDANTPGALPVHRSAKLTGDGYFYTVSDYEHSITPQNNMRQETYTFYAMPAGSQQYNEIPMYRGAHLPEHGNGNEGYIYTADRYEYDSALPANGYRQESEVFRVFGDGGAVTPTPPGPTSYPCGSPQTTGNISVDNDNFYDFVCNYAGGDLIIKEPAGLTFSASSTITIGDTPGVPCTTTGQGYTSNNEIGCVIPKTGLTDGTFYDIFVNNGATPEKVGKLLYSALPTTFSTTCGTMQAFGANPSTCKALLNQGQSILLADTRGGVDIGYGAGNYRVKKMPDDNVWQIDNLAYNPDTGNNAPNWQTPIQDLTNTTNLSGNTAPQFYRLNESTSYSGNPEYGYLYNRCAVAADTSTNCADTSAIDGTPGKTDIPTSLAPTGWKLPTGNTSGDFSALDTAMTTAATNGNPIYNTDAKQNYQDINSTGKSNPVGGVYSGEYVSRSYGDYYVGLEGQGTRGQYWSSTVGGGVYIYFLLVSSSYVLPDAASYNSDRLYALRAVL